MREISDTGNSRVISVRGAPAPSDKMSTQTLRVLYSESPRILRATSHTSLRARDYYTSSTLIGAKGRAGPTSPILEGPTEDVNARMWSTHGFLHGIEWIMLHGHLDYFQKPSLGSRSNTKPRDHETLNTHNRWFILFLSCVRARTNKNSLK